MCLRKGEQEQEEDLRNIDGVKDDTGGVQDEQIIKDIVKLQDGRGLQEMVIQTKMTDWMTPPKKREGVKKVPGSVDDFAMVPDSPKGIGNALTSPTLSGNNPGCKTTANIKGLLCPMLHNNYLTSTGDIRDVNCDSTSSITGMGNELDHDLDSIVKGILKTLSIPDIRILEINLEDKDKGPGVHTATQKRNFIGGCDYKDIKTLPVIPGLLTDDTNLDSGSRKASEQDGSRKELPMQMEQTRNHNMDARQAKEERPSTTKELKEVSKYVARPELEQQFGFELRGVPPASKKVAEIMKNFEPEISTAQAEKEGKVAKMVRELEGDSMGAMGKVEVAKKSGRKKVVAKRRKGSADGLVQQQMLKFLVLNQPGARFEGVGGVGDGGVRDDGQGRDRKRSISGASTTRTPAKKRKNSIKIKSPKRK